MTFSGWEHHRAPSHPNPQCHSGEGRNPCGAPSPAVDARGGPRTWIPAFAGMTRWLMADLDTGPLTTHQPSPSGSPKPPLPRPAGPHLPLDGGGREGVITEPSASLRASHPKNLFPRAKAPAFFPHRPRGDGVATINRAATVGRVGIVLRLGPRRQKPVPARKPDAPEPVALHKTKPQGRIWLRGAIAGIIRKRRALAGRPCWVGGKPFRGPPTLTTPLRRRLGASG